LLPVGSGVLDLRGVITPEALGARLEAAYRPNPWLVAFGEAQVERRFRGPVRASVGVGARIRW
jgi:hypothetical protein